MITIEEISVSVGSKELLSKVTAAFEPGKMNLIIGPNGAGKSTLIKVLSRQMTPTSGQVAYDKKDAKTYSIADLAKIRAVLPHDEQAVLEAMKFFDVLEMGDRNYLTLSGGEKQRVQFARVLCQIWYPNSQMRYLMLDEPLTFLDIHYQFQFMKQLTELLSKKDLVVIGVVHDLNLAARFGDNILLLHEGRVLAQGPRKDVLTKQNIKAAFQMEPMIVEGSESQSTFLFFE